MFSAGKDIELRVQIDVLDGLGKGVWGDDHIADSHIVFNVEHVVEAAPPHIAVNKQNLFAHEAHGYGQIRCGGRFALIGRCAGKKDHFELRHRSRKNKAGADRSKGFGGCGLRIGCHVNRPAFCGCQGNDVQHGKFKQLIHVFGCFEGVIHVIHKKSGKHPAKNSDQYGQRQVEPLLGFHGSLRHDGAVHNL